MQSIAPRQPSRVNIDAMAKRPRYSILLPTRNGLRYLPYAIESVLSHLLHGFLALLVAGAVGEQEGGNRYRRPHPAGVMGTQAATHWDGLAHASYGGTLYNGFPTSGIGPEGTAHCGIHLVRTLVTRGVLLDVARLHGVGRLEIGRAHV